MRKLGLYGGRGEKKKRRRREEKNRKRRRNLGLEISYVMFGISLFVWNTCLELVWNCLETICVWIMFGNLSLSKLCRKNPIRNVVGWHKMSFMVYFEF